MVKKRTGLGRGINALISMEPLELVEEKKEEVPAKEEAAKTAKTTSRARKKDLSSNGQAEDAGNVNKKSLIVDIDSVKPNPDQPRTVFNEEELMELAQSIKTHGLLQPILVRKNGDTYEIIAGERRWQACKKIGMKQIPVNLAEADDNRSLTLAMIENIQRSDLNPMEEAYGYKMLMDREGLTQAKLAAVVSKGRSTIANSLRLLDLPEQAQKLLFDGKITAGHARAILSIPTEEGQELLTKKLSEESLSVREAERLAHLYAGRNAEKPKRDPLPASYKKAAKSLRDVLGTNVRVKSSGGKNKIEIEFKDEEELQEICKKMLSE